MRATSLLLSIGLLLFPTTWAAELYLLDPESAETLAPKGFTAHHVGTPTGDWQVIMDRLPSAMAQISPLARNDHRAKVIAQRATEGSPTRETFLIYDNEVFEDFEANTRIKIVEGESRQTAGLIFHWQDADNYYLLKLDAKSGRYSFRKVVNGQVFENYSWPTERSNQSWHSVNLTGRGPEFRIQINNTQKIPIVNDTEFGTGKLGFWTQGDTQAHFGDAKVKFRSRLSTAQRLVDEIMEKYSRLVQVSIFAKPSESDAAQLIATHPGGPVGSPADEAAIDTIERAKIYYKRTKKTAIVTLPIKDRNGEAMAACRVEMNRFRGQTQKNAIVRAMPAVEIIRGRVLDREDFFD